MCLRCYFYGGARARACERALLCCFVRARCKVLFLLVGTLVFSFTSTAHCTQPQIANAGIPIPAVDHFELTDGRVVLYEQYAVVAADFKPAVGGGTAAGALAKQQQQQY